MTEKEKFFTLLKKGKKVKCPCCGQTAKIYSRKITNHMAYGLIRMYWETLRINPGGYQDLFGTTGWIHIGRFFSTEPEARLIIGDLPKLKHWGLIHKNPKQQTGKYAVTDKGMEFVLGRIKVPKNLFIYSDEIMGQTDDEVSIKECLGQKFSYNEMMAPSPVQHKLL